jgi:uncharacterized iron-regulated membrane protein
MRSLVVAVHRYVGLVLAGFLLLAGVTGSLLAWNEELDAALNPALFRAAPPAPGALPLDAAALREIVAAHHPAARVDFVPFARTGHGATYFLVDPDAPGADDQVFVDPWTGTILGSRRWGDIGQGTRNLMPFIYRLHYSLALDTVGATLLGIVALLWTIDCLAGAWLTLPPLRRGANKAWLMRWWPAWKVRRGGGAYKLNVDLHRAGGLWPWAMLFVLAWSSVAFNLGTVYHPVMRTLFDHQPGAELLPRRGLPQPVPGMSWQAAQDTGRRLMAQACLARGERVLEETMMRYDPRTATFRYVARTTADVRDRYGTTAVVFDAATGRPYAWWWPTGVASGDTIRTWITSLHMAATWGMPFKLFMTVLGVAVAMLSVTGVVIWRRKRQGRIAAARRDRHPDAVPT